MNIKKKNLLISACLLGIACRYDGRSLPLAQYDLDCLINHFTLIPFCPEQLGGLPTPRIPAEIQADGRIRNAEGKDISPNFHRGAEAALLIARIGQSDLALMKSLSPSCGKPEIYDGTFRKITAPGKGITVKYFDREGIKVYNEHEIEILIKENGNV